MIGKFTSFAMVLVMVISMILSGCATVGPAIPNGETLALQPLTALRIITDAAAGCNSCYVWMKTFEDGSKGFMFARPFANSWGFTIVSGQPGFWESFLRSGGEAANPKTFIDLVNDLERQGWARATPADVPAWMKNAAAVATSAYQTFKYSGEMITQAANSAGSLFFICVPASAFGPDGDSLLPGGPQQKD